VGELQRFHRTRGAHSATDVEREALAKKKSDDAKADFALPKAGKDRRSDSICSGLVFGPDFTSNERLAGFITESCAATSSNAELASSLLVREDGAVCVVASSQRAFGLSQLIASPNVYPICLCVGSTEHMHSCLFRR